MTKKYAKCGTCGYITEIPDAMDASDYVCPVDGATLVAATKTEYTVTKKSAATFVIAASDSLHKERADYVCDGVDDQVEIQAAIDALPSGGGGILLLDGRFDLTASIELPSYITLRGQGSSTILKAVADNVTPLVNDDTVSGNTGILISDLAIDGNKSIMVHNGNDGTHNGIRWEKVTKSIIRNIHIHDCLYHSISLWKDCTDNLIGGCFSYNHGKGVHTCTLSAIICFNGSHRNRVIGNYCYGVEGGVLWGKGIYITESDDCVVANNIVDTCDGHGIFLYRLSGSIVNGNIVRYSGGNGIGVESATDNTISNNFVLDSSRNTVDYFSGIMIICTSHRNIVIGNIVYDSADTQRHGFCLYDVSDNLIENNIAHDNVRSGFFIAAYSHPTELTANNTILNNYFFNNADYGIEINQANVTDTTIKNNQCRNNAKGDFSNASISTRAWNKYSALFMDVLAASANHVHAAIAGTGAEQEITTAITNPDVPRNVSITNSANSTGDVKIDGVDAKSNTVSDTITIVTGGIAYGVVAFATVSKITIPATVANPDTISVGISDKLGLSNIIYASGDVYKVKVNNADDPTIGTVNTTYGTVDCAVINAGDDITIWYKSNLNIIA